MPQSKLYRALSSEIKALGKTYLSFEPRPSGNYTRRQLSAAAAYTLFAHAEFETFLEEWATLIVEAAHDKWLAQRATKPIAHLCTFADGRAPLSSVPSGDIWNELVINSVVKQRNIIQKNNGIKEQSVCHLFAPTGFDVRNIDPILLGDLSAFGGLRGDHAHKSHRVQIGNAFDPFSRKVKAESLVRLLADFDTQLLDYFRLM
ncbi:hypothetical protein [Mesorhizobium marinum]|uniref:hypothetical protein n=1 Tax=Mesorhizobium marinum TaxID=3228790 RepID=UPI003467B47B